MDLRDEIFGEDAEVHEHTIDIGDNPPIQSFTYEERLSWPTRILLKLLKPRRIWRPICWIFGHAHTWQLRGVELYSVAFESEVDAKAQVIGRVREAMKLPCLRCGYEDPNPEVSFDPKGDFSMGYTVVGEEE